MEEYKKFTDAYFEAFSRMRNLYQETFGSVSKSLNELKDMAKNIHILTQEYLAQNEESKQMDLQDTVLQYEKKLADMLQKMEAIQENFNNIDHYTKQIHENSPDIEKGIARRLFYIFHNDRLELENLRENFQLFVIKSQEHLVKRIKKSIPMIKATPNLQKDMQNIYDNLLKNINQGFEITKTVNEYAKSTKHSLENVISETMEKMEVVKAGKEGTKGLREVLEHLKKRKEQESAAKEEAQPIFSEKRETETQHLETQTDPSISKTISKDSEILMRSGEDGIFIKVIPIHKNGKHINISDIELFLKGKKIPVPSYDILKSLLINKENKFTKVADFYHNPDYDGRLELRIAEDKLSASITVYPPKYYGRMIRIQDIKDALRENNIIYGVDHVKIKGIITKQIFYIPQVIARGDVPEPGEAASYEYFFKDHLSFDELTEDEKGHLDFKNLKFIQNVTTGKIIARKTNPTKGKDGRNIHNEEIPAFPGVDFNLILGKNVALSDDKKDVVATENGYVKIVDNVISVETLYIVEHDVDYSVGNIIFLGSVLVKGNVLDDFSIQATGDIEIRGSVGRSQIISENNVILHSGINGKDEGQVKADRNVIAKFIEYAKVYAGNDVIVSNDILNSNVNANNQILCLSKNSTIIGGKVHASKSIISKEIGNDSDIHTLVEIGIPALVDDRYHKLVEEQEAALKEEKRLTKDYEYLHQQEQKSGTLSPENIIRKKRLLNSIQFNKLNRKEVEADLEAIQNEIQQYTINGEIIAMKTISPGVTVQIQQQSLINKKVDHGLRYHLMEGKMKIERLTDKQIEDINELNKEIIDNML